MESTLDTWLNTFNLTGFIVGVLFGAALFLGGLADPDKIVGTLRLKDLHALRTIILFVLVGMLGTWILQLANYAHGTPKAATMVTVVLGGGLLGVGFGMTGYCPGTGLACAAAGRFDALITVLGMFAGAAAFIWAYPDIIQPLEKLAAYDFGKITILEYFEVQDDSRVKFGLVPVVFVVGMVLLFLIRPRKQRPAAAYAPVPVESALERPAEPQPRQVEIEPAVSGQAAPETVSTPEPASEESDLESSWLGEPEHEGREDEDEGPLRLELEPEEEEPESESPPDRDEKD